MRKNGEVRLVENLFLKQHGEASAVNRIVQKSKSKLARISMSMTFDIKMTFHWSMSAKIKLFFYKQFIKNIFKNLLGQTVLFLSSLMSSNDQ